VGVVVDPTGTANDGRAILARFGGSLVRLAGAGRPRGGPLRLVQTGWHYAKRH
jgi:hypothetical protein